MVDQHPPIAGLRPVLQGLVKQIAVEEDHATRLDFHRDLGGFVKAVGHVVMGIEFIRGAMLLDGNYQDNLTN